MGNKKNCTDFDIFMNSIERIELTEEQQILLSSFGGKNSCTNECTVNNCEGGNCVPKCGK